MCQLIYCCDKNHISQILNLPPTPIICQRRYVVHDEKLPGGSLAIDFDVMTELGFSDREVFLTWIGKLYGPDVGEQVVTDEARFIERSRTRAYVVDERTTSG
ncbi:MAG: hypothetical protein ABII76_24925 [Pseudomonadota bacterium]